MYVCYFVIRRDRSKLSPAKRFFKIMREKKYKGSSIHSSTEQHSYVEDLAWSPCSGHHLNIRVPKTKKTKDKTPQTFVQILSIVLTVAAHAHRQTFLQPAVLTPIAMVLCDLARLVPAAGVTKLFADWALEEAFATFTADCTVVPPWAKEGWGLLWDRFDRKKGLKWVNPMCMRSFLWIFLIGFAY